MSDIQLYSFDIFDTLINRRTATPEGIFALMQRRLCVEKCFDDLPKRLVENFHLMRIQAEKVARNTYVKGEVYDVTLSQIYESFALMEELTVEQTERLMSLEVETEIENALPVWKNIQRVKSLQEKGERVILISNMYLSEANIREILVKMDSVFNDIPMYISGELGKTKGTHTLYHYIRQQERVEYAQWYHCGDNKKLDVEIPANLGIQAELFEQPKLLPWEEEILKEHERDLDIQLLLGVSKRIEKSGNIANQVGVGYSAEILVPYVLWFITESLRKGIKRLVFIARDGYILKMIADIIIARYSYPIETTYLYGSRNAWRLPSLTQDDFDMSEFFKWNYPDQIYSYERLAEILGLSMDELKNFLPFARTEHKEISQNLMREIIKFLVENQHQIIEYISWKQRDKRERVIQYLYQELGKEENYAFVDLIGSGYTQKCLADLMKEFCEEPIQTFFYRLDSTRIYETNINYVFFPNRIKLSNVIEVLCGATHGQTVDYECLDGCWMPVLKEDEGVALQAYGYEEYLEGLMQYAEEMCALYPDKPMEIAGLDALEIYYNYIAQKRNDTLYTYIADMPYTITGQEKDVVSFAPKLSNKDLRQIYIWYKGRNRKKYYSGYSLEFSEMRLSEWQKRRLAFYKRHCDDPVIQWIRDRFFVKKSDICNSRYDLIAEKVVIYGAGKRGKLLHQQLTKGRQYRAEVLLWVDKNYMSYKDSAMDISSPEMLMQTEYEQVIIAVANQHVASEIKAELIEKGISPLRILWINPDNRIH